MEKPIVPYRSAPSLRARYTVPAKAMMRATPSADVSARNLGTIESLERTIDHQPAVHQPARYNQEQLPVVEVLDKRLADRLARLILQAQ